MSREFVNFWKKVNHNFFSCKTCSKTKSKKRAAVYICEHNLEVRLISCCLAQKTAVSAWDIVLSPLHCHQKMGTRTSLFMQVQYFSVK